MSQLKYGRYKKWLPFVCLVLFGISESRAQLSFPGCADLKSSDFKLTKLATDAKIMQQSIAKDGRIFYVKKEEGQLKVFDPKTKSTSVLLTVPVSTSIHLGIVGVALDPDFENTNWIYIRYSKPGFPKGPSQAQLTANLTEWKWTQRLSRVTLSGAKVDPASERIILEWPFIVDEHPGGGIRFAQDGNLLVSTGNSVYPGPHPVYENKRERNDLGTAANTNDLNGKILRIRPLRFSDTQKPAMGIGSTYEIPPGNFRDYYKVQMGWTQSQLDKIRPEIYSMGHRQSNAIHSDGVTGWLFNAEDSNQRGDYKFTETETLRMGPAGGRDEYNVLAKPGFYGWPMAEGSNEVHNFYNWVDMKPGPMFDTLTPRNTSIFNSGIELLPPMIPASLVFGRTPLLLPQVPGFVDLKGMYTPIAGPFYRYDNSLNSQVKFPPHLHEKWLVSDFFQGFFRAFTLDATGKILRSDDITGPTLPRGTWDMTMGPDGSMHILNHYDGLYKIEYTGACVNKTVSNKIGNDAGQNRGFRNMSGFSLKFSYRPENQLEIQANLPIHSFKLYDGMGRVLGEVSPYSQFASLSFAQRLKPGIYTWVAQSQNGWSQGKTTIF